MVKKLTAASSGALTLESIDAFLNSDFRGPSRTLVAPNKEVAKLWAKQFPGWTIVLSAKLLVGRRANTKGKT